MKHNKWVLRTLLIMVTLLMASCSIIGQPAAQADNLIVSPTTQAPTTAPKVEVQTSQDLSEATTGQSLDLASYQGTLEQIYTNVNPSVVSLRVTQNAKTTTSQSPEFPNIPGMPNLPFNSPDGGGNSTPSVGLGSGFVWNSEGYIITNNHVVDGADKVVVTFADGLIREAKVVGVDPDSDLAVVKVDDAPANLTPVKLGDSTLLKVGQMAIAIGNPYGLDNTMTVGIVSALERSLSVDNGLLESNYTIPDIIQTDAPINPGNSGGVLVNNRGEVIGVTAAIESSSGANAGIGFAIPSSIVANVVPALISDGKYEHPWLGLSGTSLTPDFATAMNLDKDQRGALVISIISGSPAEKAGLQGSEKNISIDGEDYQVGGDVIIGIDGQPVKSFEDLPAFLASQAAVGKSVKLTILRDGKTEELTAKLAARPGSTEQQAKENIPTTAPAWLGIQGQTLTKDLAAAMKLTADQKGVLVNMVVADSPAEKAGMKGSDSEATINGEKVAIGGDIILKIGEATVETIQELRSEIQKYQPGDEASLTILRGGSEVNLTVTFGEQPQS